ncbi:hypothetical protein TNCV_164641 [Trichonephila clavipes]|nr:hypothetical protein TNCV_164641 [Trichonephila clavipes]
MGKYELSCSISRKTRKIRRLLKDSETKSSSPFVKKQEIQIHRKNRIDMKHREISSITGKIRSFQRQPITTNITQSPCYQVQSVQRFQDSAQKGYYNKTHEKTLKSQCFQACSDENYSKSQIQIRIHQKLVTLIVMGSLRTKEIFFGKVENHGAHRTVVVLS